MKRALGGQTSDIGRGRRAEYVRWIGDRPEVVAGTFVGLVGNGWKIVTDAGTVLELSRDEWDWCLE